MALTKLSLLSCTQALLHKKHCFETYVHKLSYYLQVYAAKFMFPLSAVVSSTVGAVLTLNKVCQGKVIQVFRLNNAVEMHVHICDR